MTEVGVQSGVGLVEQRPAKSRRYPWYDSVWLEQYTEAKSLIREIKPSALADFVDAFRILHTRPDFRVKQIARPFNAETFAEIKRVAATLGPSQLELHEARTFGRFVVHDHPFFAEVQQRMVPFMSEIVGEPVGVSYNFASLYTTRGVCPVHMDAPSAKWTLDLCIDQTSPWPIHFSEVQPWPDAESVQWSHEGWEEQIKRANRFTPYAMEPGNAIAFSGSSQWHYRDAMPGADSKQSCTLLFLHFIPRGTSDLVRAKHWARYFGIPELSRIAGL